MIKKESRNENRIKRHNRIRKNLSGTSKTPRLNIYRSNTIFIYKRLYIFNLNIFINI